MYTLCLVALGVMVIFGLLLALLGISISLDSSPEDDEGQSIFMLGMIMLALAAACFIVATK